MKRTYFRMNGFISLRLMRATHILVVGTVLVLLLNVLSATANATVIVSFERLSDTSVRMTGTGTITTDPVANSNNHLLYFDNLFASLLPGHVNESVFTSSTMTIGTLDLNFSYTLSTGFGWDGVSSGVYVGHSGGGSFATGDSLSSGYVDLALDGVTASPIFAPEGSSGDIYWGLRTDNIVGSWTMSNSTAAPVPEPSTWILLGTGLAGLAYYRRKKS